MKLRLSNNFNMIKLDQNNIIDYIPEIKEKKHILDKLIIAHRVDYYRVLLLNKYGGLYLDADIIVLNDLKDIIDKLKENDYIGFGCTGYKCTNGYGKPSNWAMGSKANGIMISRLKKYLENILDNITEDKIDYHTFGKLAIWEILDKLIKNENYKYYHYDSEKIGTRDIDGKWITNHILVSNNKIKFNHRTCIRCFCCSEMCPEGAIGIKYSFLGNLIFKRLEMAGKLSKKRKAQDVR
jgi:ferredoxin